MRTSDFLAIFTISTLMESNELSELFPLFNTASPETLEWFLSVAEEEEYAENRVIITPETWGQAVYFIVSGWVKLQRLDQAQVVTLEILGQGDFLGEMAILDETPRATEVVALSSVKLLAVSAQRFLQTLYKDTQIQHRMLQLMARRIRHYQNRLQLRHKPAKVKLAKVLIYLADHYGRITIQGTEIYHIPNRDLADLANIKVGEAGEIMDKLESKGWLEIDHSNQVLCLTNLKHINHLVRQSY